MARRRARAASRVYALKGLGVDLPTGGARHPDAPFPLDVLEASKDPERMVGHIPRGTPRRRRGGPCDRRHLRPGCLGDRPAPRSAATSSTASPSTDLDNARRSSPRSSTRSDGTGRSGRWSRRTSPSSARTPTSSGSCICSNARWSDSIQAEAASTDQGVLGTAGRFAEASSAPRRPGSATNMRPFIDELALWRAGRRETGQGHGSVVRGLMRREAGRVP